MMIVAMARARDRHPDALPSFMYPSEEEFTFAGSSRGSLQKSQKILCHVVK